MSGIRHLVRVCRASHQIGAARGLAKRVKKDAAAASATGADPASESSAGSSEDATDVDGGRSRATSSEPGTAGAAAVKANSDVGSVPLSVDDAMPRPVTSWDAAGRLTSARQRRHVSGGKFHREDPSQTDRSVAENDEWRK